MRVSVPIRRATEQAPERVPHAAAPWWAAAVVVAATLALRAWLALDGNGFRETQLRPSVWHLVEPEHLRANPLAPLWDVHATPPLYNVFVGIVLRWSPLPDGVSFRLLFTAGAVVASLALCGLLHALGCRWWIAAGAAVVAFSKPSTMTFEYYVAHEAFVFPLLYVTLWAAARYAREPSLARLGWMLAPATVLVLTRAQFHPLWLAGLVAIVVAVRPPPGGRRTVALVAAVPFVLIGGLMVKNEVRFGSFSLSSWSGMNLTRVAVAPLDADRREELTRDGDLSPLASLPPFASYETYAPYVPECDSDFGTPVLDDPDKGDAVPGSANPNFNAACYVPVFRQAQEDASSAIRHAPGTYVRSVGANVVVYLSDTPPAQRYGALEGRLAAPLETVHDVLWLEVGREARYPNGFVMPADVHVTWVLGFTVVLVAGARAVRARVRGATGPRELVVLAVAWTVVYVTVISVVFDAFENGRFRAPLDPLVMGVLLGLVGELAARAAPVGRLSRPR